MSERRRKRYSGADGDGLVADHHGPETGAPIILLHGGGQTRRAWDRTAAALAQADCLAITVDQRGHGDSDWPEEGAYRFFDFARDAAELATQVHDNTGQAPSLVGASLGGIAGLIAQLDTNQHAFSRLILVDITPRMDPRGVSKITGFMRENLEEGFATLDEAADAIRSYLPHRKRLPTPSGLAKNLRQGTDGRYRWHWDPRFLEGAMSVETETERAEARLIEAARALAVPSLLVRGQDSDLVGLEHAREFLELAPHARFVDVSGAGHMVAGDQNDAFTDAILEFVADV